MVVAENVLLPQRMAAVTTISLRTILNLFQYSPNNCMIFRLRANGSTVVNAPALRDHANLGMKVLLGRTTNKFDMNYSVRFDENGIPINAIDAAAIQTIEDELAFSNIQDAVVSGLELIITDDDLEQIANAEVNQFHVKFSADKTDGELDKNAVKRHPENRELIQQNRMTYRILNCREVIDRRQELTQPQAEWNYQILWIGENLANIHSPIAFAQQLFTHFGNYKLLKEYDQTQEDKLELIGVTG